ncbi:MAG TPA: MIP/aquaporin family protein [Povalibacter sp.]|nr:MIP/aquaporin family protein [Povalibacter sp.]
MRRAVIAEALGSMLLAAAVIGSGIMAQRLTADGAVALLANALATVSTLAVLIVVLAPISGAHLNPAVSIVACLRRRIDPSVATAYVVAQVLGCLLGALLAHAMFDLPALQISTHTRTGLGQFLSEVVATAGLITIAVSCTTPQQAAWRIPAWIGAAYWFTASTSFANPAITIARAVSDTFSGIRPADVPAFVAAQLLGALVGMGIAGWLVDNEIPDHPRTGAAPERT